MTHTYEFHFQEGFYKNDVRIEADGRILAEHQITTRMQTGLAEIVSLQLAHGTPVAIHIQPGDLLKEIALTEKETYVIIRKQDDILNVQMQQTLPGYY